MERGSRVLIKPNFLVAPFEGGITYPEAVEAAGPGGTFIDREHTAKHFRRELWFPRLLDRNYYDTWLSQGALSTRERCRQRKEDVLRRHVPEPIPPDLKRELSEIVAAARRHLSGNSTA